MVNTRTNFYEGDLAYAVRVLSEDLIPIIRVLADNKEIVSALAQSKVQDWNKVLVSLARDPGKWSTIKWRNPQLRQEEMLDNDKKLLWVEKVVSFINYVQNEHGGKVMHTVDLSNSTYARFLSANSAQSSSAGDQALKAAVYELPSGTPCLGLSCRALNNTPVIPITDKYVPKGDTLRQGNTASISDAIESNAFGATEFLDSIRHQRSAYSAKSSPADAQDMRQCALARPPGDLLRALSHHALDKTPTLPVDDESVPELRQNNSAQIKFVHGDDSITVPSTVTDSYNTFGDDPEELSFFDALD